MQVVTFVQVNVLFATLTVSAPRVYPATKPTAPTNARLAPATAEHATGMIPSNGPSVNQTVATPGSFTGLRMVPAPNAPITALQATVATTPQRTDPSVIFAILLVLSSMRQIPRFVLLVLTNAENVFTMPHPLSVIVILTPVNLVITRISILMKEWCAGNAQKQQSSVKVVIARTV
jgi:hypothetical protein